MGLTYSPCNRHRKYLPTCFQNRQNFFCSTPYMSETNSIYQATFGMLYFEKSSNLPKIWQKMKKSLVQLALNIFVHGTSKNPKPRFQVPNQSLQSIGMICPKQFCYTQTDCALDTLSFGALKISNDYFSIAILT